jgi:integrase
MNGQTFSVLSRCCRAVAVLSENGLSMTTRTRGKLTETLTRSAAVPIGKKQVILWDGSVVGFGLRCYAPGARTWIFVYRAPGGGRKAPSQILTLGSWPTVSVEAARKAARGHAGAVANGRDPAAERREERRAEKATLRLALDDYERSLEQRRIVNVRTTISTLRRGLAALMKNDVRTLTRGHYVAAIAVIERGGRLGAAEDLRKHSRTFAEWCVARGLADFNPLAGLRRPRLSRAERLETVEGGRALSDPEIKRVWEAAGTLGTFGSLVRLALLTAMRRGELSGLRWDDVKADRIVLDGHRTKTGAAHEIPLTELMRDVFATQSRTGSSLVFPSSRISGRILGWTKLVKKLVKVSGVKITMHDTRRTCRTLMSRLEVPEDVAELAIGHQRADLVARYNFDQAWRRRVQKSLAALPTTSWR